MDYITPVVDDPYTFGAIAAANALSDLYAMGARPTLALNLVGYPVKSLPLGVLEEILRGGADKVAEAGASLVGGHSVDDHEPKYGLAVTGLVHPDRVVRNVGARRGDRLVLTKPLGLGIITTGIDRGLVNEVTIARAVTVMTTLNAGAARAMLAIGPSAPPYGRRTGVHAATDVTGFGLLGHLREMLAASGVAARVWREAVPVLDEAWDLAAAGCVPDGSYHNFHYLESFVVWEERIERPARLVLCDAQTSGGLLLAVSPERTDDLLAALQEQATPAAAVIGEVVAEGPAGHITVAGNR
ncbi:MAG: selenide, water dikinase [Chloroflexota bacterium]|nr:MAG: selenide, water dikinase [Chloroflexota bacterium]